MEISNSRAKTFENCKKQYEYKYVRKIQSKVKERPLYFGSWMHQLLQAHYSGGDWREVHTELSDEYAGYFDEEKDMLGNLPVECKRKMMSYLYHYREEDEGLNVLATEIELEVEMPHGHVMKVKLDMITEDEIGLWLWEHKNHERIPDSNQRFADIQTARYAWAIQHHPDWSHHGRIAGIVWNYLVSTPAVIPKLTKKGVLSKAKLKPDYLSLMQAIRKYNLDPNDYRERIEFCKKFNPFFERIPVPTTDRIVKTLVRDMIYAADEIERGKWKARRNIGRHCNWCFAQKLCMTELYGGDAKMIFKANYEFKPEGGEDGKKIER